VVCFGVSGGRIEELFFRPHGKITKSTSRSARVKEHGGSAEEGARRGYGSQKGGQDEHLPCKGWIKLKGGG